MKDKRLIIKEDNDKLNIVIYPAIEKHQLNLLGVWLGLWVVIGISVVGGWLAGQIPDEARIATLVFMAFWMYFFYRIFRSYRWFKNGKEEIVVDDSSISISHTVGKRGIPIKYPAANINKLRLRVPDTKSFQFQMENSFWIIGGDTLTFAHNNSPVMFGKKLTEKQAKKLMKLINDRLGF